MKLFHVSYDVKQSADYTFFPRIPESSAVDENMDFPRICFADSIINCMRGINGCPKLEEDSLLIRVYEFEVLDSDEDLVTWEQLYKRGLVPDAALTHEYWYLRSVSLSSKLFRIRNIKKSLYIVVSEKQREKIINIIREVRGVEQGFDDYNACDIINDWVKEQCEDRENIFEALKSKLSHLEKNTEVADKEIYFYLFGEYPQSEYCVNDYYELELIDACDCEEIN